MYQWYLLFCAFSGVVVIVVVLSDVVASVVVVSTVVLSGVVGTDGSAFCCCGLCGSTLWSRGASVVVVQLCFL